MPNISWLFYLVQRNAWANKQDYVLDYKSKIEEKVLREAEVEIYENKLIKEKIDF
jgi:hypothetical protein